MIRNPVCRARLAPGTERSGAKASCRVAGVLRQALNGENTKVGKEFISSDHRFIDSCKEGLKLFLGYLLYLCFINFSVT